MIRRTFVIVSLSILTSVVSLRAGETLGDSRMVEGVRGRIDEARALILGREPGSEQESPSSPVFGTAGEWYPMALEHALAWSNDVIPVAIFNTDTLDVLGTSRGWGYSFFSEVYDSVLYVQVSDAEVQFDQPQPPLFNDPIGGSWIDTDLVLPLVDASGGSTYRQSNSGVLIQAFLAGENYDPCTIPSYYWTVGYTSDTANELDFYVKGTQAVLLGFYSECIGEYLSADGAFATAEERATAWAPDAELYSVESLGVADPLGRSTGWAFEFLSPTRDAKKRYHTCGGSISADLHVGILRGRIPEPVPDAWWGSAGAAAAAEAHGGSAFRGEHPLAMLSLSLTKPSRYPFDEHLWVATYDDLYGERFTALVGAVDGEFRGAFRLDRTLDSLTTSDAFLEEATSAALAWRGDAYLYGIVSTLPLSFMVKGASPAWAYLFHSPQGDSSLSVVVQGGSGELVTGKASFSNPSQPGALAPGWIHSDSATAVAAEAGGEGVGGGAIIPTIEAALGKGLFDESPERLVWRVVYSTPCHLGTFYIDAYTGEVLDGNVGVERDSAPPLPGTAFLSQNYPNPFNPQTMVRYEVTESGGVRVRLAVYDLHGRRVRTLVDDVQEAGAKSVFWDGRNERGEMLGSGIYLMRLEVGTEISVRKMLLLK